MRFLVDEDLPRSVYSLLIEYGHEATQVRDTSLRGAPDTEIAAYAKENNLCLITADAGFSDIRHYPPRNYSGIVVLHLPPRATSATILSMLRSVLMQTKIFQTLTGKLAIIEAGRIRIRKT
jgi:predicted nuclease of predicted toxin-antitoxin system